MPWFKASWVYGGLSEYGDLGILFGGGSHLPKAACDRPYLS